MWKRVPAAAAGEEKSVPGVSSSLISGEYGKPFIIIRQRQRDLAINSLRCAVSVKSIASFPVTYFSQDIRCNCIFVSCS